MDKLKVKGTLINLISKEEEDFISLTDIAKSRDSERTDYIIQNWLRSRSSIEFLGLWEKINNPHFNPIEFDGFVRQAGSNSFSLTPKRWIEKTDAIGMISRSGRSGGTYAHKDIAFEFASWISSEFKLYLIKEFQRLKDDENERRQLGWDLKRSLARINYVIHTDAIKNNLVPKKISKEQERQIYANEADVLNVALFGITAKEWRDGNPKKEGNMRDYTNVSQLVCLANLENLNAQFIKDGLRQSERLVKLNDIAIIQMQILLKNHSVRYLEKKKFV